MPPHIVRYPPIQCNTRERCDQLQIPAVPPVWRAPEGPEGTGGLRDRPLRAAGSRVAISRASGPEGARNISGATNNNERRRWLPARTAAGGGAWPGFEGKLHHTQRHKRRRCGGRRRVRRARLRCPWAAAGPGRASRRRTQPHTATQAPPVWRGPEGQAAVPVGGGGAWPGFETTHPATHSDTSAAGVEGAGGPGCGARGRRRGLAGLRGDAPSEARGADGSRAGRRPRAHQAARPSKAHQAARPQHTRPHTIQA